MQRARQGSRPLRSKVSTIPCGNAIASLRPVNFFPFPARRTASAAISTRAKRVRITSKFPGVALLTRYKRTSRKGNRRLETGRPFEGLRPPTPKASRLPKALSSRQRKTLVLCAALGTRPRRCRCLNMAALVFCFRPTAPSLTLAPCFRCRPCLRTCPRSFQLLVLVAELPSSLHHTGTAAPCAFFPS